jgi:hypothetical protein
MNSHHKNRTAYIPSVTESRLEERLVLSSLSATPPPAAPPVSSSVLVQRFGHPLTVHQLRAAYTVQVEKANAELRSFVKAEIRQLYSSGSVPSAEQQSDFTAMVDGAIDATAVRLSTQAALLPNSSTNLVPAIQNELLGSGSTSLANRLSSLVQSRPFNRSINTIEAMATRRINSVSQQNLAQLSNYFTTTPVVRLAVNSSGQPISLTHFLGGQIEDQVANTLGSLAQSFPGVANAVLFPVGSTTTTVNQSLLNGFTSQSNTALSTAAFQIGGDLELFPGFMNVTSQLQQLLLNSTANTSTSTTSNTISAVNANNLATELGSLEFGSPLFNSAVASAFNTTFQNVLGAISPFLGVPLTQSTPSLPTTGFTSLFGSQFSTSSFNSGFNNGFLTGTGTTGFLGFGTAPTDFNANFATGFNNVVSTANSGARLPGTGATLGGIPVIAF